MAYTIQYQDANAYVCYSAPMQNAPIICENYWKITNADVKGTELHYGQPMDGIHLDQIGGGEYWPVGFSRRNPGNVILIDPTAPPVFTKNRPYICPKVRKGIETRYYYGQWQKLLKSGWTAA